MFDITYKSAHLNILGGDLRICLGGDFTPCMTGLK